MAIDQHDDEAAARALLAAAEVDTSPGAQRLRAGRHLIVYLFIVYMAAVPIFFGVSLWRLTQALQSGAWIPFWFAAMGVVALLLPPLFLAFYDPLADRNSRLAYRCLYNAVASSSETLAPALPLSKAADTRSVKMKYVQVIGEISSTRMAHTLIIQFASIGLMLFLVVWISSLWPIEALVPGLQTYLPFMIALALSLMHGIISMFFVLSQAVGYTVIADGTGLRWRKGVLRPNWIHVRWDEVRVSGRFAQVDANRNKWEHDAHAYILEVGEALLSWGVNPFEFAAGGIYTPKEIKAEWERFAAFITARSELPLRDITPVALALARATGGRVRERKVAQILLARHRTAEPITITGLERAVAILAAAEYPQRQRLLRALSWMPLALFVALYIVGAIIQFGG